MVQALILQKNQLRKGRPGVLDLITKTWTGVDQTLENSFVGLLIFDCDFTETVYSNKAACAILGILWDDFVPEKVLQALENNDILMTYLKEQIAPFITKNEISPPEIVSFDRPSGTKVAIMLQVSRLWDEQEKPGRCYFLIQIVEFGSGAFSAGYILQPQQMRPLRKKHMAVQDFNRLLASRYSLSPAELKTALLVLKGKTSKGISDRQKVSVLTVNTHRRNIRKKLNIPQKASLFKFLNDLAIDRRAAKRPSEGPH